MAPPTPPSTQPTFEPPPAIAAIQATRSTARPRSDTAAPASPNTNARRITARKRVLLVPGARDLHAPAARARRRCAAAARPDRTAAFERFGRLRRRAPAPALPRAGEPL